MDLASETLTPSGLMPGVQRVVPVPDPAAGAGWTFVVPGEGGWEVRSLFVFLQTTAVVATRIPRVTVDDGTRNLARIVTGQTQAASIGATWTYSPDFAASGGVASQGGVIAPFPSMLLLPGYRVIVAVGAMDALDTLTLGVLTVNEISLGREAGPFPVAREEG